MIASCSSGRNENIHYNSALKYASESEIIKNSYSVRAYNVDSYRDRDIAVAWCGKTWPFESKIGTGHFNRAVWDELVANKVTKIECLCFPVADQIYILSDQWGSDAGCVEYCSNHNSINIFDAEGRQVNSYRFQESDENGSKIGLFVKIKNTVNVQDKLTDLMK